MSAPVLIFRELINLPPSVFVPTYLFLAAGAYVIYQCYFAPLADFPGPFPAKLTRFWYALRTRNGLFHREIQELHAKYGSVVRIAPDELVKERKRTWWLIRIEASNHYIKGPQYEVIQSGRHFDITTETNEEIHARMRRLVMKAYTMNTIKNMELSVDVVINATMKRLDELQGQVIDLGYWIQAFSFDVIGTMGIGQEFGFVREGTDHGILRKLQKSMSSLGWLQHAPWLLNLHNAIMPIIGNLVGMTDRNGVFFDWSKEEVESWKKRERVQMDMVGIWFDMQKKQPELDDLSIKSSMSTNIFAGTDTTSTSMRVTVLLLSRNPDKLAILLKELDEKRAKGELSDPATFDETENCPYLQAVMYEVVRLWPAVGSPLARVVPKGGLKIGDKFVPEGSLVGSTPWIMNHVEELWGPDHNEFKPERWLQSPEIVTKLKANLFSFGGGSRTCIGKNLAWFEMAKFLATLIPRYDIEVVDGDKVYEEYGFVVYVRGLKAILRERQQNVSA